MASEFSIQNWFESREALRHAFLSQAGWEGCDIKTVGEDCAFRRYLRLDKQGKTALLMESVPDDSPQATAGHKIGDFIRIGQYLQGHGINTPDIYESDLENGYALLEDFGDCSFKKAGEQGQDIEELYNLAAELLAHLAQKTRRGDIELPSYYDSPVHQGRGRVVDWYMPATLERKNPDGLTEEYLALWQQIEETLPPCPQSFQHIDYHFENLMWLPDREGIQKAGLLDFQGAMWGPSPYDLANLLEDARVDVPHDLREAVLDHVTKTMTAEEEETFRAWYRVLATQFHCRVIGQFIKLALRAGKPQYMAHIPRVGSYLEQGLQAPLLAPLKDWFAGQGVTFTGVTVPDLAVIENFIRKDAF